MVEFGALRPGFAFVAGVATFFAPCAFPLLPGYLAYFLGDEEAGSGRVSRLRRASTVGLATSLGFIVVLGALAGIVAAVGAELVSNVSLLEPVIGAALVVLGVAMFSGWSPENHVALPERERSLSGYFTFGVVYAVAAAGCVAPIFIAVAGLGITSGPGGAVVMLGSYALGMSVMMVGTTAATALGRDGLVKRLRLSGGRLQRVGGVLLVLAGIAQTAIYLFYFGGMQELGLA